MRHAQQFILYTTVGAIGTIVHYATLIALVQLDASGALAASVLGFTLGAIVNYLLNYYYTFRSQTVHRSTLAKFMTVALIGLAINSAIMVLMTNILQLHYLIAQVTATAVVLASGFITNRWWTFRESEGAP